MKTSRVRLSQFIRVVTVSAAGAVFGLSLASAQTSGQVSGQSSGQTRAEPHFVRQSSPLAEDVINTLYGMRAVYRSSYAPANWKRQYAGYDVETEFQKALAAVNANPLLSMADARVIFKNFIYAMKDYHTSISFASTELSSLPFQVKGAGGHYFLVYIDRAKLSAKSFPFNVGDEVVSMNDVPVSKLVDDLQAEIPANVPTTDHALAEMRLTARSVARGLSVPQGPVVIEIKPKGSAQTKRTQLLWDYSPEKVKPRTNVGINPSPLLDESMTDLSSLKAGPLFHPQMSVDLVDSGASSPGKQTEAPYDLGARKTFTPDLGPKIWESPEDNTFYAYIYKTPDRRLIGYLRLPKYSLPTYAKAVSDFASIIERFEATTDAMVIDQVNNPGGSVFYLYTLASMLSDSPLTTPRHQMTITQTEVTEAVSRIETFKNVKTDEDAAKAFGSELDGFPATYETARFTLNYAEFIVDQWSRGHQLSDPYWISGADQINPNPVHYTKPILLLINHLDFSGGDFFPTILQDNHRVTVMGGRTAGAGGYVNDVKVPNDVGILSFRITESIADRVTGHPIENLGVTPDIPYEMTADDYQSNYAPYIKAVQSAVSGLTKGK